MPNREAIDTITGYFYQFDKTILEILSQDDDESVIEVESIEDIDINTKEQTKAIQCKYHAKTEYNHSEIKKPIILMVEHFAKNQKTLINYHFYGHFKGGQAKLGELNVDKLKKHFLTYSERKKDSNGGKVTIEHRVFDDLGLDDSSLQLFLERLSLDINAPSLEEQYSEIIQKLSIAIGVNKSESEFYHYNCALKEIRSLSIQQKKEKRRITKKEFLEKIKEKDVLFDLWFIRRKGRESYIKSIKKEKLSSGLNMEPYDRFFLIDCDNHENIALIKEIAYMISKKWSKISKREQKPFCPAIYFYNLCPDKFRQLKKDMYSESMCFTDGYPFLGADPIPEYFYTKPTKENGIKFRLVNSSDDLDIYTGKSSTTVELYDFYQNEKLYDFDGFKYEPIKIENLSYVRDIIK